MRLALIALPMLSSCIVVFPVPQGGPVPGYVCAGSHVKVGQKVTAPNGEQAIVQEIRGEHRRCRNPSQPNLVFVVPPAEYKGEFRGD